MQGENCSRYLQARVMAMKISQVGGEGEEGDLIRFIRDHDFRGNGKIGRKISDTVVLFSGERQEGYTGVVVARVGSYWDVVLRSKEDGGEIVTLFREGGRVGGALVQDPPSGAAAKTVVTQADNPYSRGVGFAYVSRETHYSFGLLWDPGEQRAADIHYYEDGTVKMMRRYQGGRMMGRGDHLPCHASYWPNGNLQSEEYGHSDYGRFRNPSAGPAYAEYHPNGKAALEVYALRDPSGQILIARCGTWDESGKERVPGPHETRVLSETCLTMMRYDSVDDFSDSRRDHWTIPPQDDIKVGGGGVIREAARSLSRGGGRVLGDRRQPPTGYGGCASQARTIDSQ